MSEEILKATEVAKRLGVSRSQVYAMARDGAIPSVKLSANVVRFRWSAVLAWIEANERRGEPVQ